MLAGCGSSASPPFAVSCTVRHLPGALIRATATITNSTTTTGNAIIYGPVLFYLHQFSPVVLQPARVTVRDKSGRSTAYLAFAVPHVRPGKPTHLVLTFLHPPRPGSIAVTATRAVRNSGSNAVDNPACVIK